MISDHFLKSIGVPLDAYPPNDTFLKAWWDRWVPGDEFTAYAAMVIVKQNQEIIERLDRLEGKDA